MNPAVGFYHKDGLIPSWNLSKKWAGEGGHVATLPEIIEARLAKRPESGFFYDSLNSAWGNWFTTASFEVVGKSTQGNPIIIVGHGNLPLGSQDVFLNAYSYEFHDKSRTTNGGRISKQMFKMLESGQFGEVSIVDLRSYTKRYQHPFIDSINSYEAMTDPLVSARLGPRADEFVEAHHKLSIQFQRHLYGDEATDNPLILRMGDAYNCPYTLYDQISRDGLPLFHLLSISPAEKISLSGLSRSTFVTEVNAHEWNNTVRFVGVPEGCNMQEIVIAPTADEILVAHWRELREQLPEPPLVVFARIVRIGDTFFSMYGKKGASPDTFEPQFEVKKMVPVGTPVFMAFPIAGYYSYLEYSIEELLRKKPQSANAYDFSDPILPGSKSDSLTVKVQFYKCEFDTSRQVIRKGRIWHNPGLMLKFALRG